MTTVERTDNAIQANPGQWFDELVASLRTHQVMLETNTADEDTKNFYNTIMLGNALDVAQIAINASQKQFVSNMLLDYLKIIKDSKPIKLAFDYNDSEVLVWAEIDENNEQLEKQLYLAEAEINARYHKYGFDMTSMIVENSDNLSIPNQYITYIS